MTLSSQREPKPSEMLNQLHRPGAPHLAISDYKQVLDQMKGMGLPRACCCLDRGQGKKDMMSAGTDGICLRGLKGGQASDLRGTRQPRLKQFEGTCGHISDNRAKPSAERVWLFGLQLEERSREESEVGRE